MKNVAFIIRNHSAILITSFITSAFWVGVSLVLLYSGVLPAVFGSKPPVSSNLSGSVVVDDVDRESRIVDIVDVTTPAVVSIVISKDVPILERYYRNVDPFGFGGFFGGIGGFQLPQYRQNGTEKKEIGGGTGFFVSEDGLIVTNRHVVSDPEATYTVFTNDGKKYDAKVLTRDTLFDVALLQVSGSGFSYLDFGNSDNVRPGQTAIAIGNALAEFRNSVSVGVVSGLSRSITAGDQSGNSEFLSNVIQTDAAINPGNSGGPLLNLQGQVIGINVAAASGENVAFSLPSNTVKSIVDSVKKHGSIVRPYLGIRYMAVTPELVEKNNLPVDYGVLVARGETPTDLAVIPGSPADRAGIIENDIIVAVDGVELRDSVRLNELIGQKQVGQSITLRVYRKGEYINIAVTLRKMPSS